MTGFCSSIYSLFSLRNLSFWPTALLSVQWVKWHPVTHLIETCSPGPTELRCTHPYGPGSWTALQTHDSPGQFPTDSTVFLSTHTDLENSLANVRIGNSNPRRYNYSNKNEPNQNAFQTQDSLQSFCLIFCQKTLWQAYIFVTSILENILNVLWVDTIMILSVILGVKVRA